MNHDAALARLVAFYETLEPETLAASLATLYAPGARFKDPFNEVQDLAGIARIFTHMFDTLDAPRFTVNTWVIYGAEAFLAWEFHFRSRRLLRGPQCIRGATHLRFGPHGLVCMHRDYWDPAEELYEKVPVLRVLARALRRAAGA